MDIRKLREDVWSVFKGKCNRVVFPNTPDAVARYWNGRYCFCLKTNRYDEYVEEFSSCRLELEDMDDGRYLIFSTDELSDAFVDMAFGSLLVLDNPERRREIASNPEIFYDEIAHMLGNSFTEDRVASKIAELYVYLKLLENGIKAVFGGFEKKSLHDINCGEYVIEVKSTQKHHEWPVTTNQEQMKARTDGVDLYLCLVRLEPTEAYGDNVYSIDNLMKSLGEYSGTDSLPNMPRNSSVRGKRFLVQEVRILQVTQSFPRPYLEGDGAKLTNYTLNLDPDALSAQDLEVFLKQKGEPGRVLEIDSGESAIIRTEASEEAPANQIIECADSDQTASSKIFSDNDVSFASGTHCSEEEKRHHGRRTNLKIIFNDGHVIFNKTAKASLIQFIKEIGADRIAPLNIRRGDSDRTPPLLVELVSDTDKSKGYYTKEPVSCGYYVWTYSDTAEKKEHIEKIIEGLKLGANVEIVDDTCPSDMAVDTYDSDADKAQTDKSEETCDGETDMEMFGEVCHSEETGPDTSMANNEPKATPEAAEDELPSGQDEIADTSCNEDIDESEEPTGELIDYAEDDSEPLDDKEEDLSYELDDRVRLLLENAKSKDSQAFRELVALCKDRHILHEDQRLIHPKTTMLRVMERLQQFGIDPGKYYQRSHMMDTDFTGKGLVCKTYGLDYVRRTAEARERYQRQRRNLRKPVYHREPKD